MNRLALTALATSLLTSTAMAQETYTVQPGDTLSSIAHTELGNDRLWTDLCAWNSETLEGNCDLLVPGSTIMLGSSAQETGMMAEETMEDETSSTDMASAEEAASDMDLDAADESEEPVLAAAHTFDLNLSGGNAPDGLTFEETADGFVLSGTVEDPNPRNRTDGVSFGIPRKLGQNLSGETVTVTITGMAAGAFQAAYSTRGEGNSGWRDLEFSEDGQARFSYEVEDIEDDKKDFIGILPDPGATGQSLTIQSITLSW